MKSLAEKILYLNEVCKDSIVIEKYVLWEVHSYQDGSLLRLKNKQKHKDIETAIDMAVEFCEQKLKEEKNVINT